MVKRFTPGRMKIFASMPQTIPTIWNPSQATECEPVMPQFILDHEFVGGSAFTIPIPGNVTPTLDTIGVIDWKQPLSYLAVPPATINDGNIFLLPNGECDGPGGQGTPVKTLVFHSSALGMRNASISGNFGGRRHGGTGINPPNFSYIHMTTGSAVKLKWVHDRFTTGRDGGQFGGYWAPELNACPSNWSGSGDPPLCVQFPATPLFGGVGAPAAWLANAEDS